MSAATFGSGLAPGPGIGRRAGVLVAASTLVLVGFVVGPRLLAPLGTAPAFAGPDELAHAAQDGFVAYWLSGDAEVPASLSVVVDYWQRYHLVKAVFAALLAALLIMMAIQSWRAVARPRSALRLVASVVGAVAASLGGLVAITLVMANVQGAIAPFASLLPMIVSGSDPAVTSAMDQARAELGQGAGAATPEALAAMVHGVTVFHVVLAVLATAVGLGLVSGAVILWRRRRSAPPSARRVLTGLSVAAVVGSLAFLVLALANVSTAARPAAALLALLAGSW